MHCDTAYKMYTQNKDFQQNDLAISAELGSCFKKWFQTFAVFISEDIQNPFLFYKNTLNNLKQRLTNTVTPVFAVEGGSLIDSTEQLYELKNDGIRFIALTWNGENKIAGGVKTQKGLTAFGKTVITKMNELKIAVDVSHLNEKSFYGVIQHADKILATHSNCKSVCDVPRNLSEEQIKLIAQKGGIIGLNFYPLFLGGDFLEKIYENICHLCDMGLESNIAIGTDFDGAAMDAFADNISKIPQIFEALQQKGLKKELLNKIFFKNANDFLLNL